MKKIALIIIIALSLGLLQACKSNKGSSQSGDSSSVSDTPKNISDTGKSVSSATAVNVDGALPNKETSANSDDAFLNKAAVGGMAEVAMAKLALSKTNDPKIKYLANMMVTDHGKANNELTGIAKTKNITLPASLDAEHKMALNSMSKLSGKDFDVTFMDAMVAGHQKTLGLMQDEAKSGQDPDIKAFAAKTTPVVQMHLNAITAIRSSLK